MRADVLRGLRIPLYWPAILPTAGLLLLGLLALSGLEVRLGLNWVADWHVKQAIGIAVGIAAGAAFVLVPYKTIVGRAYLLYGATLLLLVAVLLVGVERNYARRWIELPGVEFQPSELMKLALVITLARYIRFRSSYKTFKGLFTPFLLTLVPMGLILVQPDLGTALLFIPILFTTLFAAGARPRHLLLVVLLGAAGILPLYHWGLREYQKERIDGFLVQLGVMGADEPGGKSAGGEAAGKKADAARRKAEAARREAMAKDENYQLEQSKIAVGAGGFLGADEEGAAGQVLYRVPERQTDFVFAAVANRWGFLGGLLVVALLGWLLVSILAVAARHRDPAGRLLCLGVFAMLAGQAFINLAMTVGLMPVTGLTLPFLSYGRSSLVVCMLGVALVCNVAARPAYDFGRGDFD
ncbi:MAG: FtsW/RodA/SpoVE family cell cycle protein [Planctomycetes bacterium]|nr:FtsW/RodA/SpoVE family cell cycle protein [Planctomycetota bacterium]